MRKIILFFVTTLSLLMAVERDKIEIMAEDLSATESTVIAKGNVVVHYGESVIQSSSAYYDRIKQVLRLEGDKIELLGDGGSKIQSEELKINTKSKKVSFKKVFVADDSDVWVYSDKATKFNNDITFGSAMMSSCDVDSKDWALYSKSSHYDTEKHYITMRDVKVKFWDIPVMYTPYLAFSTHKERSSGLLFPSFGYSQTDGAVYEQPIYWAASRSWDVELRPQLRTTRGVGVYGTLRFADSAYSAGAIRVGYFKDNEDYTVENSIRNESHYGFEMLYDSSQILERFMSAGSDVVDGLYINATLLNDIDYIFLQKRPMSHFGASPLQESRVNYFVQNDAFSGGIYGKYFIDTRLEDNNATMQILPTIQLHKYLKPILLDRLTYSMNLTTNNFTREEGTTLTIAEFYAPVEYTHTFLDDLVTLSLKEDLYYNSLFFGNGTFENDDFQYYNNISRVKLFSDLTKKYGTFVHVLQPSVTYSIPGNGVESPVAYEELDEDQKYLYAAGVESENVAFKFSQYFYNDSGEIVFYERFTQLYHPEKEEYKFDDFSHEMEYNVGKWKFYNTFIYNYEFSKIREMSTAVRLQGEGYGLSVTHSYQRLYSYDDNHDVLENKRNNDINLNLRYQVTNRIGFIGGFIYNIDDEFNSQYRVGFGYNKDCWNIAVGFRQDVRPTETTTGTGSILDNSFTFQLNFVPFGGVGLSSDDMNKYQ